MLDETRELLMLAQQGTIESSDWPVEAMAEAITNKWLEIGEEPEYQIVLTADGESALRSADRQQLK